LYLKPWSVKRSHDLPTFFDTTTNPLRDILYSNV
jgi:hypothetical protein